MTRILIREDVPELELLLAVIVERAGHEAVHLARRAHPGAEGDLLLVAPDAAGALAWAQELRREQPDLPIVCVGPVPADPHALAFHPSAVIQKPFRIEELRTAVDCALHARSFR